MSNKSKYIIFAICIILIIFITSGTTYLVVTSIIESKNPTIEKEPEPEITLTSTEINNYLKYVPKISTDYEGNLFYSKSKITIDDISNGDLVGTALGIKNPGVATLDTEVATEEEINTSLQKMYNKTISLDGSEFITDGINVYTLKDSKYIAIDYTNYPTTYQVIDKYEISKENLIIYTYVALRYPNSNSLDNPNGAIIKEFTNPTSKELIDYIKENKKDFPLFKHVFEKNETGYSWSYTENISDNN